MVVKTDLPAFWDAATGGNYPAAAVTMRMRSLSEAGLLPRRREPLRDHHKAMFLIGLYASVRHVGAVEAARRVADLTNPAIESGEGLAWQVVDGRFEDVLARLIHDLRLGVNVGLPEVSICSPIPQAVLSLRGLHGEEWKEEIYRWSSGTPRGRFGQPTYSEHHISHTALKALALIGSAEAEAPTAPIVTSPPDQHGTEHPNHE